MKKIFILLFVLTPIFLISQKTKTTLILKDNTVLEGNFKYRSNNKIEFRKNKKSEKKKFGLEEVKEIVTNESDGSISRYEFKKERKKKKYLELKILSNEGELVFYEHLDVKGDGTAHGTIQTFIYFISRKNQDFVDRVRVGTKYKKFYKIQDEYFGDCPDIVSKIASKYFENEDVIGVKDIVNYYNTNCSNIDEIEN